MSKKHKNYKPVKSSEHPHYLTVGRLKEIIKDMPDDALVLQERVEDFYFNNNNWFVVERPCPDYKDNTDEYIPVWCGMRYPQIDENLYLTPHY